MNVISYLALTAFGIVAQTAFSFDIEMGKFPHLSVKGKKRSGQRAFRSVNTVAIYWVKYLRIYVRAKMRHGSCVRSYSIGSRRLRQHYFFNCQDNLK